MSNLNLLVILIIIIYYFCNLLMDNENIQANDFEKEIK